MWQTGTATDYVDLIDKLDTFLTTNGSAFGLTYAGTGNGTLTAYRGGASSVAETFAITATSSTNFTVVGSVSGSIGPATVGTPFSHAKIAFTLTAGGTAFVAGDAFTLSTAPKWTQLRRAKGCHLVGSQGNSGQRAVQNIVDGKVAADATRDWAMSGQQTGTIALTFFASETFTEWAIGISGGSGPKDATLQRWNGSSWVTLDARTGMTSWTTGEFKVFTIASPVASTLYQILLDQGAGNTLAGLDRLELRRSTSGFPASYGEAIWQAPGNDGTSAIYVGIHSFMRPDVDYYNWELAAFDGWNSAARFTQQAGFHGQVYVPLWNTSMTYWFVVNGRRAIVVAKLGTQYEVAYLGLLDAYFSPGQMPYPMALGGSLAMNEPLPTWENSAWRYSNATDRHSAFPQSDAGSSGSTPKPTMQHQMVARRLDGAWEGFEALAVGAVPALGASTHQIWPYRGGMTKIDPNLDGSYALWPVMLNDSAPNTLAQLPGVFMVSGQSISAESLVRLGAIDHLALPNISRVARDNFFAVALD